MSSSEESTRGIVYEEFLGRNVRSGSLSDLALGTYRTVFDEIEKGNTELAIQLLDMTLLEADELHDIYGHWTDDVLDWLRARNVTGLDEEVSRLRNLLGDEAFDEFESRFFKQVQKG